MKVIPIFGVVLLVATLAIITLCVLHNSAFNGSTVHLVGDSTLADQSHTKRPDTGWGEPFDTLVCDSVRVINHAKNGRSSKSFKTEGVWQSVWVHLRPKDVVLIQFGHNDQKHSTPELYADAWQTYRTNLQGFVSDVRSKGATPVLLTPIVRRSFDSQGALLHTLGEYPAATRAVAEQMQVTLIDLNRMSREVVEGLGPEASKVLYAYVEPGKQRNYWEGKQDDTHLSPRGASRLAEMAAVQLRKTQPSLFCHKQ